MAKITRDYLVSLERHGSTIKKQTRQIAHNPYLWGQINNFCNLPNKSISDERVKELISKLEVQYPGLFHYRKNEYCLEYNGANCDLIDISNIDTSEIVKDSLREVIRGYYYAYLLKSYYRNYDNNDNVIAYSHRIRGFNKRRLTIDNDFEIVIKTNFGYGNSSYFYATVIFQNVSILRYSRMILYDFAEAAELLLSTKILTVDEKSWNELFDYIISVYNDYRLRGLNGKFGKYVRKSLSDFVMLFEKVLTERSFFYVDDLLRLEKMLDSDISTYLDNYFDENYDCKPYEFSGVDLYIYRGKKVLLAIDIVDDLKSLSYKVEDVSTYEKVISLISDFLVDAKLFICNVKKDLTQKRIYLKEMHKKELQEKVTWETSSEFKILGIFLKIRDNLSAIMILLDNNHPDKEKFDSHSQNLRESIEDLKCQKEDLLDFDDELFNKLFSTLSAQKNARDITYVYLSIVYEIFKGVLERSGFEQVIEILNRNNCHEKYKELVKIYNQERLEKESCERNHLCKLYLKSTNFVDNKMELVNKKRDKYNNLKQELTDKKNMYHTLQTKSNELEEILQESKGKFQKAVACKVDCK